MITSNVKEGRFQRKHVGHQGNNMSKSRSKRKKGSFYRVPIQSYMWPKIPAYVLSVSYVP